MFDKYARSVDYMRISITDRCNLRCRYCMPDGIRTVPMNKILTYENICDIVRLAVPLGIRKYKITGGEPLARLGCPDLVGMIKAIPGVSQVTLTTNGVELAENLDALLENGLDAVNISLDTLKPERFAEITARDRFDDVMRGVNAAVKAAEESMCEENGCGKRAAFRVKVNCVLQKGMNDDEWLDLALLAKDRPLDVRFIEMMPIGFGKKYNGVGNDYLYARLKDLYPDMIDDRTVHGNGPAVYVKIPGFTGSIGFISAMHGKFCDHCNRIRLTSQGRLKPCLCFGDTVDLMPAFAETDPARRDEMLRTALTEAILMKPQEHSFEHLNEVTEVQEMVSIGG